MMTSWTRLQADVAGGLAEGIARVGPRATRARTLIAETTAYGADRNSNSPK
ncbi:predicted protein [Plenodomus lingam JN3]|uniref:Predicted protein n=1 Tax=Leptosphaeria maculans (strain JN3 / isolate v23.1.3 / race Av1-4-5-6-7-8) TaxID=985895 RepID=E5AAH9_LEPMJ|nr:predicted protein [Plenodomus lingam JN3]CBY00670.1 predicted protein [Plenodomus lingam JN3]